MELDESVDWEAAALLKAPVGNGDRRDSVPAALMSAELQVLRVSDLPPQEARYTKALVVSLPAKTN